MFSIIVFIVILSFLVLIHELGHFIVAKKAGVTVEEFGIGYPPLAIKLFRWKGTDFTVNWIPFGGFVRMSGEEEVVASVAKDEKKLQTAVRAQEGMFYSASSFAKLAIILAGETVNFLFGVVAFSIVFTWMGIPTEIQTARIGAVAENSPAAEAQLPANVDVIAFQAENGEKISISKSQELVENIAQHRGERVTLTTTGTCTGLTCEESAAEYSVYLRTESETPLDQGSLGIVFEHVYFQRYVWWQMPIRGAVYGCQQALYLGQQIIAALGSIGRNIATTRSVPDELAGPVGIVHQAQSSGIFSEGPLAVLSFAGMLSVNLAIMNVLPIPPLDGGRAVIILLSPLISKKYLSKFEYYANYSGYVLLLGLIIFITIRDISRVIIG